MNFIKRIFNHLGWWVKPSCDPLAKYSFDLSKNLVLGTLAYIFFSGKAANVGTVLFMLLLSFGLALVGIALTRLAKNNEERDNGNLQ